VRELAEKLEVSPIDVIKELMANGILANINQQIDYDTAAIVAGELGFETREEAPPVVEEPEPTGPGTLWQRICENERPEDLKPRPPVVTVMGHVDHGKTSLLDAIRHTDVAAGEVGGITQRIGAYQVESHGKKITFLDTPGHEAFTAMRARGAQVTDLAVLVVAADDGVMPQTKEAIDHARAAHVPIVVALNKIDKPNANPDLVKQQLADQGLQVEEWGGDVICVPLSAKKREGIDDLLENILLVAEVSNLRANPSCPAVGTVVEGQLDKSKGPMATVLIQNGTLRLGDAVVVGRVAGRIRNMLNDKGKPVREALPSMPVSILGLADVPQPGDILEVVENENIARAIAAQRALAAREAETTQQPARPVSLDDVYAQIQAGKVKELNLILKANVQGSIEPIKTSLERLGTDGLKVKFIHTGTGNVTESDVALAVASKAVVIAFSVDADAAARRLAEAEGIDIRFYDIIYKVVEDVEKALKGMLEPKYEDVVMGRAEVRALFHIPRKGTIGGSYVTEGKIARNAKVRVLRGGEKLFDGKVASLRRFTEDVNEVNTGFECGIGVEGFNDLMVGDILEFYRTERVS
jgi:translation initiation factor IF-2